jgi:hypothetical protein
LTAVCRQVPIRGNRQNQRQLQVIPSARTLFVLAVLCALPARANTTLTVFNFSALRPDLPVARVFAAGLTNWCVHLPAGTSWTHLWTGTTWRGGVRVTLPAPIGQPPVFWRDGSVWDALFRQVRDVD